MVGLPDREPVFLPEEAVGLGPDAILVIGPEEKRTVLLSGFLETAGNAFLLICIDLLHSEKVETAPQHGSDQPGLPERPVVLFARGVEGRPS